MTAMASRRRMRAMRPRRGRALVIARELSTIRAMPRAAAMTEASNRDFAARLDAAADIERLLDRLLTANPLAGETARPRRLIDAMRHASLGGGKRLRPFLAIE